MSVDIDENGSGSSLPSGEEGGHHSAHQYWLSLLSGRPMPTIGDLSADRLNEFKNHSFLLAITGGGLSPVVSFAGKEIFAGAGADGIKAGASLDSIAKDSLLALLADKFTDVKSKSEPIEFEEKSNGENIAGMLMPFGAEGAVQFVWGVVSTKPNVEKDTGASFDGIIEPLPDSEEGSKEENFAEKERVSGFDAYTETFEGEAYDLTSIVTEERSDLGTGLVPEDEYYGFDDRADSFEGDAYEMTETVTEESSIVFYDEATDFDLSSEPETDDGFAGSIAEIGEESGFDGIVEHEPAVAKEVEEQPEPETEPEDEEDLEVELGEEPEEEPEEEEGLKTEGEPDTEDTDVPFFNILADGRTAADGVVHVDQRSRNSLYEVLAKAYALFEHSLDDRETYLSILKATGIGEQKRAPFTPIIKLVFGKSFDKTRITEYAAALSYAQRLGQSSETLPEFLANQPGGIKGCVHAERIAKRKEKGIAGDVTLEAAKEKLRLEKAIGQVEIEGVEEEFVILLAKNKGDGVFEVIKALDEKNSFVDPMIKRAVKPN